MKKYILILVVFVVGCQSSTENKDQSSKDESGIPWSHMTDLNGEKIPKSVYENKLVVLNFWATWCKPCIAEMPSLLEMKEAMDPKKFALVLATDDNIEKITQFKSKYGHDFQYVTLEKGFEPFGVYSLPTTIIIKPDGTIHKTEMGGKDWASEEIINELNELL